MLSNHKHTLAQTCAYLLICFVLGTLSVMAADPGANYPASSMVSDQKAGSLLVYNVYASSASEPQDINSRLSITNTSAASSVAVHLFFIDGASCTVADSFLCLTPNQTISYLASDIDPGVTGFLIAVAVDRRTGQPINFNHLIGDVFVKIPSGHFGNLLAESFAATFTQTEEYDASAGSAMLWFDGSGRANSYNPLPRTLAADNLSGRATQSTQYLIVNRIGGDLSLSAAPVGTLFGLLFDDAEQAFSFNFTTPYCQLAGELANNFPRTVPRLESVIPAGRTGWMRLTDYGTTGGILGSVFDCSPVTGSVANAFNGAHNLHKLSFNLNGAGTANAPHLEIPLFPPAC